MYACEHVSCRHGNAHTRASMLTYLACAGRHAHGMLLACPACLACAAPAVTCMHGRMYACEHVSCRHGNAHTCASMLACLACAAPAMSHARHVWHALRKRMPAHAMSMPRACQRMPGACHEHTCQRMPCLMPAHVWHALATLTCKRISNDLQKTSKLDSIPNATCFLTELLFFALTMTCAP